MPDTGEDTADLIRQGVWAGIDHSPYSTILARDPSELLQPWDRWYLGRMQGWRRFRGTYEIAAAYMRNGIGVQEIDQALDILSMRGVPLDDMSMTTDLGDVVGVHEVTGRPTKVGLLANSIERKSAGHAFAQDWIVRFYETCLRNHNRFGIYASDPKVVRNDFLAFAEEWATQWKTIRPMPSKACIAYCRRKVDGMWKGRAYGESVTSLFLSRFALEIAWSRRARYHFGVDDLAYIGMSDRSKGLGYRLESEIDTLWGKAANTDAACQARHEMAPNDSVSHDPMVMDAVYDSLSGKPPVSATWRVPESASSRISSYGLSKDLLGILLKRHDGQNDWMRSRFRDVLRLDGHVVMPADLDVQQQKLWKAVPGIIASVFLDHARISPDHTFIFMLLTFIEAEACRTDVPLLPRHHPAYRIPVRKGISPVKRLDARIRGIVARRKSSVEHLGEYSRFGWFHVGVCRLVPLRNLPWIESRKIMPQMTAQAGLSMDDRYLRKQRFPGLRRNARMAQKALNIGPICAGMELVGRFGLLHRDFEARAMACLGWERAKLSSPTIRSSRTAYAAKYRPMSERVHYLRGLSGKDAVFRGVVRSDYVHIYNGQVMPELMDMMVRKTRNEFRCGTARYGFSGMSGLDAEAIAIGEVRMKLRCLASAASSSRYAGALSNCTYGRYHPGNPGYKQRTRSILSRDPFQVQERSTAPVGEVRGCQDMNLTRGMADEIGRISYRGMMESCRRMLTRETSDYPFIAGAKDQRVFAAWKQEVNRTGRLTSRNRVLAYLDYVARHAAWSGVIWDIMTGISRHDGQVLSTDEVVAMLT